MDKNNLGIIWAVICGLLAYVYWNISRIIIETFERDFSAGVVFGVCQMSFCCFALASFIFIFLWSKRRWIN